MNKRYMLGADLGGGAVKALLLSTEGKIVSTATVEYPTHYPHAGWAEQDPEEWYSAFVIAVRQLLSRTPVETREIQVLAIDAATHIAVLMDDSFNVLRPAIFWTDQRSEAESERLDKEIGSKLFDIAFHRPNPVWTLPQLLWVKEHQPEIWRRTERILFAKDYLRYRVSGVYATDHIDAMGTLFFDPRKREWSDELCNVLGFPMNELPKPLEPSEIVGTVTDKAAQDSGLHRGTQVIVGTTDTALELFASGAIAEGQATVKLATAGRVCIVTDRAIPHPHLLNYRHVVPDKWYPGTATKACASSFRWYKDTFGDLERSVACDTRTSVYAILDEAASGVTAGAEGLFFHPYLIGELTPYFDPLLRGSFTGISMKHTKAHFSRAVLEGVGYSVRDCMKVMDEVGVHIRDLRIIGGGAKSPLWRQIVADILGREVKKMYSDDSSLGSAMLAGIGMGYFDSFQDAVDRCTQLESLTRPDPDRNRKYSRWFDIYREIQQALVSVNHRISEEKEGPLE